MAGTALELHPDRLLPAEPSVRAIARRLYDRVRQLPLLDAPDAIQRFRAAVTETAGFSRTSGFVDDTRALCSIPARHGMSRRVEAGFLARLVAEHRLGEQERRGPSGRRTAGAAGIAVDLASTQPKAVFNV